MAVQWIADKTKLDPEFATDVEELLAASEYRWVVLGGFRTPAEQAVLHDRTIHGGPLAAAAGHSAHNYGLAVDVAPRAADGTLDWNIKHPAWPWLWAAVKASPRLHSGHDFPPVAPADNDHIQAVKWYKLRDELKRDGKWND